MNIWAEIMAEPRTLEETPLPPYFDRFIEERDRRLIAELGRLDTRIVHNAQRIDELRQEMERRIGELRQEMDRRFTELRQEMDRRFVEAAADRQAMRSEISRLDAKMDAYFRWTIGLMIPIVLGVLAIIIRVFLLGPIP